MRTRTRSRSLCFFFALVLLLAGCAKKEPKLVVPPKAAFQSIEDKLNKASPTPRADPPETEDPVVETAEPFPAESTPRPSTRPALEAGHVEKVTQGAAQGTLEAGGGQVVFSGSGGRALLVRDSAPLPEGASSPAYDLVLDEDAPAAVTLRVEAPAPPRGAVTRIKLGLPTVDSQGREDFLWLPLETARSGDVVSAQVDLADYAGAVAGFQFAGGGALEDDVVDFGRRMTDISDAQAMGVKYAVRYFSENVYEVVSEQKHFSVNIPETMFNDDTSPKAGKLRVEDAQRLGEDLEALLADYKEDFPRNTRSAWPVQVEKNTYEGTAGGYGGSLRQNGCVLYLSFEKLSQGYKDNGRYDGVSATMYHTLAHEMFHFIQWEYTNKQFRALWFDEATAVYFEDKKGDAAGENSGNPYYTDKEDYPALRQYYGITPATTFFTGRSAAADDGYGRKALIEYLVKEFGDDFLPKLMPGYTVTSAGKPMEDLLTKQTGKTMAELTRGYYDALVARGELKGAFTDPWEICMGTVDTGGVNLSHAGYYTRMECTGKNGESVGFPLPRYGVHFVSIETKNLPARYESFTIRLDTPNTTAILMEIGGEGYDDITEYRSWEDGLDDIYLDGRTYLLMVINESDTHYGGGLTGSEARISVTWEDMNEGLSGSYPQKARQVPAEYEGTWTRRVMQKAGYRYYYTYETLDATARVSLNEAAGIMTVRVSSNAGEELYSEQLTYNASSGTGTAKESSFQLERGDYEERELMGIRIHDYFGTAALHAVFEGYGWVEEEEKEVPKPDYSGSYRASSDEIKEDVFAFGIGSYRRAVDNAFLNASITISRDGSFSGSGSWSGSTSETDDGGPGIIGSMNGSRTLQESVSASVSIQGKLDEDGEGTFTISGTASVSGSANGSAREHSSDGVWPMQYPDPDKSIFSQVYDEYNCEAKEHNTWEYTFTLSGKGSADISNSEKPGSGQRVPALWLSISSDIRVSGQAHHTLDVTYPGMDWDETHNNTTSPAPDSAFLSGLYIYYK